MAGVPLGKPDVWISNVTFPAPVTAPLPSRGTSKVMITKPRPVFSALVIGGTSLAGLSWAVKTMGPLVGPFGLSSSHPATSARTISRNPTRRM